MSKIHYFQRYSQKENVVTNNTLLLFSRLYNDNPSRFEDFINLLLADDRVNVEIGLRFRQQKGNGFGNSVPDGSIIQKSMKVLIETKLYDNNDSQQLLRHFDGFGDENSQVMLLINAFEPTQSFTTKINQLVSSYNDEKKKHIEFCSITFKEVITAFSEVIPDHDTEFKDMLDDFPEFRRHDGLLPRHQFEMRAITSGDSFTHNMEHSIYYDAASRGYRPHQYMGLYNNKAVKAIGVLKKVILADVNMETREFIKLEVKFGDEPTVEEKDRILAIMADAFEELGWNISKGLQFFIVEKFYPTDYKKVTKYPIQRTKYFDLGDVLGKSELPNCEELAEQLKDCTWG